ncbi:endonuclease [Marinicella sediminis]|uniref:Endonuclease n=1 Tax=Marinicella sediminis TaxID=1792834 RepID=A0ABV7JG41_9GAMM|nr:endonuclease [Marinicella sediminis]
MKSMMMLMLLLFLMPVQAGTPISEYENLLITEVVVTPTDAEMIEIHNKGGVTLDLTDVYLTDATFSNGNVYYYQVVSGAGGGGDFNDFFARFPNGASIAPGAYQTISINGSDNFFSTYGVNPTYELFEDGAGADTVDDMVEATPGSIDDDPGGTVAGVSALSGGEVAVLFYWDGNSDLVQDIDYVVWGDKREAVDKTGISIDGPDADAITSVYLDDTVIASQAVINASSHAGGNSWQRGNLNEGNETGSNGNGVNGDDETSEDLNNTFFEGLPTPNAAAGAPPAPNLIINEVDAVSSGGEFVEIYGSANTSADNLSLVFYDGDTDQVYQVIDLTGSSTDSNGFLLVGNTGLSPDVTIADDSLQDGADAVALYNIDASAFIVGDPVTVNDIMDALVYDSGQADDAGLLTLINPGQSQIDEGSNGNAANESMARCPNASGGSLNTSTYQAVDPTPGVLNSLCPLGDYYATADDTNATTLRNTLHEIIDDHIVFPYSAGTTDTWDVLSFADEDPNDSNLVWMIYKNNSYTWKGGGQQAYNREHTWPQSYGFSSGSLGDDNAARTDAHHLMLSDVTYNGNRGNLYFDDCNAGCTELTTDVNNGVGGGSGTYPGNSNWFDGDSFEVWNFRKGDIARAMFYMDLRYAGDVSGEVDLQLTDNPGDIQTGQPFMGLLSVLIDWHNGDPVDSIEQIRNERVYSYQGNRNPFIDHPEWVECIFVQGGACTTVGDDLIFASDFD